jgi:signal transduction histidine kinase
VGQDYPILVIPTSVAAYSAAAYRTTSSALFAAIAVSTVANLITQIGEGLGPIEMIVSTVLRIWLPAALGFFVADRRRWMARDRDNAARDAVNAERARIARELHDVVAHGMGMMVVQEGGARSVLRTNPDEVERALRRIEHTGRNGLVELRRLLEVDRDPDGLPLTATPVGLDHLDHLVGEVRDAGVNVDAVVEGRKRPLPPGIDVSGYRIIQEALTNTMKHSGSETSQVVLRYSEFVLEIEVNDDGRGSRSKDLAAPGAGRGLVGMKERVVMFGGELETGPRPGGGFSVRARFPIQDES